MLLVHPSPKTTQTYKTNKQGLRGGQEVGIDESQQFDVLLVLTNISQEQGHKQEAVFGPRPAETIGGATRHVYSLLLPVGCQG